MKKRFSLYICISIFALVCAVSFSYVFAQTTPSPTPSPTPSSSPALKPPANTYWFQNGAYPSSAYAGTSDTYISKSAPTTNYGSAGTVTVSGPSTAPKRALLRFDLGTTIPASCKVKSAALTLNFTDPATNGYWVYEMKRNWSETQATWNQYATGLNWQTAGATGSNDRGTSDFGILFGTGVKTTALSANGISFIQNAVTNRTPVNFFILFDQYTDSLGFSSKNAMTATQRPKLQIVCEIPYMKGDANRDQKIDISDVITIANLLQQYRPTPKAPDAATVAMVAPCTAAADYDNSGRVDINDATSLISFLFGTPRPNPVQPLVTAVISPTICTKYP